MAYVHPLPKAIELVRVLCQASRVLAERCVEEGLLDSLMRFVVGGTLVPTHAAHALFIEAVRAWTACALYGLHVHAFPNLFPHLLPHAALSSLSSPSALARSAAVLPLFHALTAAAASSVPCPLIPTHRQRDAPRRGHHLAIELTTRLHPCDTTHTTHAIPHAPRTGRVR